MSPLFGARSVLVIREHGQKGENAAGGFFQQTLKREKSLNSKLGWLGTDLLSRRGRGILGAESELVQERQEQHSAGAGFVGLGGAAGGLGGRLWLFWLDSPFPMWPTVHLGR